MNLMIGWPELTLIIMFVIIPILIAVKFPTVRMAMGIVQIVIGLILISGLWWLFGLGLILGGPLLLIGLVFLFTGYSKQKRGTTVPQVSKGEMDVLGQLKQLKELLDSGAITKEEFEEKKKHLLGKI